MPSIVLHFETTGAVEPTALAEDIQSKVTALPSVEGADTNVQESRSLDPATIIQVISLASTGIMALTTLIENITKMVHSTAGLKEAIVEIDGKKIPVSQLTPADIEAAAK